MSERILTSHKVGCLNEVLTVRAVDAPGAGGASHCYKIDGPYKDYGPNAGVAPIFQCDIRFQNGPAGESIANGISNESLLAVVIDRLQGFQTGEFKCRENAIALTKLEEALHWLQHRTRERAARGVEGVITQ